MPRLERDYQPGLRKRIEDRLPGAKVFKPNLHQGAPDLLILCGDRWGMLEVKKAANAKRQPNQDHYVAEYDDMSFAAVISPENEEEVLHDLEQALCVHGSSCATKR